MAKESSKISKIFGDKPGEKKSDWLNEYEGQLALDAYQNNDSVIVKAPIAGVKPENLEVAISENTITIKGERKQEEEIGQDGYLAQECYWGAFSRQINLPPEVDTEKAVASLKNGVLTIKIPKLAKSQARVLKVTAETD